MASAPTEGLAPALQAQFHVLQQRYVQGLAGRWRDIDQALDAQTRQQALHRLSGSAASFGFEQLSRQARAAEHLSVSADVASLALALTTLRTEIDLVCKRFDAA